MGVVAWIARMALKTSGPRSNFILIAGVYVKKSADNYHGKLACA